MGVVYSATDTILSNTVAVKVLLPREDQAENAVARFEREAKATAKLGHPNIVRVMDMGRTHDGGAFLVMERLSGETLDETLEREGPLSVDRAVRIHLQLLDALAAAHAEGVLHRDVKPSNVFLTHLADGTELVKLLDFGLAYLTEEATSKRLTATGIAMGTPAYMSPERITGESLDHRSDIYSVGVSLFRSLTGELPFNADTGIALRGRILLVEAPLLSDARPDLAGTIAEVVAQALSKSPVDRFSSAREMAAALTAAAALFEPSRSRVRPRGLAADGKKKTQLGGADLDAGYDDDASMRATALALPSAAQRQGAEGPDQQGRTILGHGVSVPLLDEDPLLAAEEVHPRTLPLGGVSVPPAVPVVPETPTPQTRAHPPTETRRSSPWFLGIAIGLASGVAILAALYLWHVSSAEETPRPSRAQPARSEPSRPNAQPSQVEPAQVRNAPEIPRGVTPPPVTAPPPTTALPTTALPTTPVETAQNRVGRPAPADPRSRRRHDRPTPVVERRPPPVPVVRPLPPARPAAVDGVLEPDWSTPLP